MTETKKKPGRPKKNIPLTEYSIKGILSAPLQKHNLVEFTYNNPKTCKKIFTLFKSYHINEITWNFQPEYVEIRAKNRNSESFIIVRFNCKFVERYYCGKSDGVTVTVKRDAMEKIFKRIDKNNHKVDFYLMEQNYKNTIYLTSHDKEMDNVSVQVINLMPNPNDIINNEQDEETSQNNFEFPFKHFKKLISDI